MAIGDAPKLNISQSEESQLYAERNQKMRDQLLAIVKSFSGHVESLIDYQKKIIEYYQYLKNKYPDAMNRRVLHILIGSTMGKFDHIVEDDFPGDDSVEKFIDSLTENI